MPPSSAWNGQIVRSYFPPAASASTYARRCSFPAAEHPGGVVIDPPSSRRHVLGSDERVRARVAAVDVDEVRGVEDLERLMRVERGDDLRDRAQVPVEERAQAPAVVERARSRAAGDEELEAGRAERVLRVHEQETDAGRVVRCGLESMLGRPRARVGEARFVVDAPHLRDALEVDVRRERQLARHEGKARETRAVSMGPPRTTTRRQRNEEKLACGSRTVPRVQQVPS